MPLDTLNHLKDFLADRPAWAFLALSLMVNLVLYRRMEHLHNERLSDMKQWLPVADRLGALVSAAASKVRKTPQALPSSEEPK